LTTEKPSDGILGGRWLRRFETPSLTTCRAWNNRGLNDDMKDREQLDPPPTARVNHLQEWSSVPCKAALLHPPTVASRWRPPPPHVRVWILAQTLPSSSLRSLFLSVISSAECYPNLSLTPLMNLPVYRLQLAPVNIPLLTTHLAAFPEVSWILILTTVAAETTAPAWNELQYNNVLKFKISVAFLYQHGNKTESPAMDW
jgi:hypothetical protein